VLSVGIYVTYIIAIIDDDNWESSNVDELCGDSMLSDSESESISDLVTPTMGVQTMMHGGIN